MQRLEIISSLTDDELEALEYDWYFWARPNQLPPDGDWSVWNLMSGRGFGKTRAGAEWVNEMAYQYPYTAIALVGQTKADVRDTMVELGGSSIIKCSKPWFVPKYEPSKRRLTWPNGSIAMIYSGDEPDQLRGPQHGFAWVDELCKFKYSQDTWDNLEMGMRLGKHPKTCVTTTPRNIKMYRELIEDEGTVTVTGSTFENARNLPQRFLSRLLRRYKGTRLGRQELYAEVLTDTPGALWTIDKIDEYRVSSPPSLYRIVVAIDPAVTSNADGSNETGIVVVGLDENDHGYVLADLSGIYTPHKWARKTINAYDDYQADAIVGEVNNGGDLVETNVTTFSQIMYAAGERDNGYVNFRQVRATRGKYTRAEPISSLYEQGNIHHVGALATLEDQMCTWVPGEDSPDRMDALVWGFTDMLPDIGGGGKLLLFGNDDE